MLVIVLAKVFLDTGSSVMKPQRRRPWPVYMCDPIAEPWPLAASMLATDTFSLPRPIRPLKAPPLHLPAPEHDRHLQAFAAAPRR